MTRFVNFEVMQAVDLLIKKFGDRNSKQSKSRSFKDCLLRYRLIF